MAQHELEISPKGKQKKSLCQILLAKKGVNNRVGCMAVDSVENDESLGDEMQSARIGLCCAVTDTHGSPTVSLPRNSNTTVSTRPLDVSSINKTVSELKTNGFSTSINNRPVSSPIENTQKERSRLRRRVLTQRRSADNLYPSIPPSSPLRFSSPESSHSAPVDTKVRGSVSHDTVVCNTGSPSMDSLARQALLAAQVLHLIPTTKARQRNYLQGRIGANSLLGPIELERVLPNREVKIFIGSWNMNEEAPPRELNDFILPNVLDYVPDILAIGTQESCSEKFEWEVSLQETLGPSHVLLHSATLGTLHLAIFIRRDLIWYCSICEEDSLSVRPGTAFKTKGAVAIAFMLFGTSYLFVTAHLTAHQEKVKERVSDIKRIIRSLDLPKNLPVRYKTKGKKDVTQNFDCVFWCGDLNFRLTEPRDQVLDWIRKTNFPLPAHLPHGMLHVDQLQAILADGAAFKGFQEAKITFPPTYKYDPGSQKFDTSAKQRTPAYTDRILFKYRTTPGILNGFTRRPSTQTGTGIEQRPSLECIIYDSVPGIVTSDHKPVWGVFKSIVRPGDDTTPLAAGMFNREVYLEGIKRRVANLGRVSGASTVCSIQ